MSNHTIYTNNNLNSLFELYQINQTGGNHHNNRNFIDIFNNGWIENYSNSCMWISILQYLNNVLNIPININDLRTMGKINQNENHSIFDDTIPRHLEGLQNIANAFNLEIICLNVDDNKKLYDKTHVASILRIVTSETDPNNLNKVYLASYGMHFQLIIKCNYWNIDITRYFGNYNAKENEKKFLVFNDDSNNYVNINELGVRTKLLEQEIKQIDDEIKTIKLIKDDKSIDSSILTTYKIRFGELIGEKSEMNVEIIKNKSTISKIKSKRQKYKEKSLKDSDNREKIKQFIQNHGGMKKTKEFAINFLLERKIEIENNIIMYKNFDIPDEEKEIYLNELNNTLLEIDEGLRNLDVIN
jgi:hypothetical protein